MARDDDPGPPPTTVDSFIRAAARAPEVAPVTLPAGTMLGGAAGYEIRERLGAGGMATVYRALDRRLGREVAIKIPRVDGRSAADRARLVRMFEREAEATAQLNHLGIVTLHHVGDHEGTPFLVLELLIGETLAARLARRRTLPVREATAILDAILSALGAAHDRGFVHRDLTPRNVFLTTDDRVKIVDFGVAVSDAVTSGTVTRGAGTPGYMAPEHGGAPDARTDLWAAAVLFLECVTGERSGSTPAGTIPDDVPPGVRDAVTRALSHDPDRRPTTAAEMRAALAPELIPVQGRRRRRTRVAVALVGLVALAGVVTTTVVMTSGTDAATRRTIVPRDGRWRADPAGGSPWEVRIQHADGPRYTYENHNRADGRAARGVLTLERLADGSTILSGQTADVPNCATCTNVGFVEFIVLGASSLYQNRSGFGPSHDNYTEWFPPYRYVWLGPAGSVDE